MTTVPPVLPPAEEPPTTVRDLGLSYLRTAVPLFWGYVLTWLAMRAPAVHDLLDQPYVTALVTALVTLAWYAVARRLEAMLPAWLTRVILGANTAPVYPRSLSYELAAQEDLRAEG